MKNVDALATHPEPAIRYKLKVGVLGESADDLTALRNEIRDSNLVRQLLSQRDKKGRIQPANKVYAKWQGAHWTMATLADIGYPESDGSLLSVRDQLLDFWLADRFYQEFEAKSKSRVYGKPGVPVMQGRHRRCASQQSNACSLMNSRCRLLAPTPVKIRQQCVMSLHYGR